MDSIRKVKSKQVFLKNLKKSLKYRPKIYRLILNLRRKIREKNKLLKQKSTSVQHKDVSCQTDERNYSNDKEKNNKSQTNVVQEVPAAWNTDEHSGGAEKSIAEQVKEAAQSAMAQSGMVYVESAGMYYDYKTGYYYNSELGLYYHSDTGCYYYYSDEKQEFVFHSYPDTSMLAANEALKKHEQKKAKKHKQETQEKPTEGSKSKKKRTSKKKVKETESSASINKAENGSEKIGINTKNMQGDQAQEKEKKIAYTRTCSVQKQHALELARLKNKYVPEPLAIEDGSYKDRAKERREAVGSSHHSEKTQQSDLETSIAPENKGFKLLQKMGWSKGEGLGKDSQGAVEPVPLVSNESKVGLGAVGAAAPVQIGSVGSVPLKMNRRSKPLRPPARLFRDPLEDDDE